jgi:general stress protein CsbA
VEVLAFIDVVIFNRSKDTTNRSITIVFSTSIVVIANDKSGYTSNIWITGVIVALIIIFATIRDISNYTSLIRFTVRFMTVIIGNTFGRNINEITSRVRTTGIIGTFVIIVTFYGFILTRVFFCTVRVTSFFSTGVPIVAIYCFIIASPNRITRNRVASILIFADVRCVCTTTSRIAAIISTFVVIITVNFGMSTSRFRITSIISTSIIIITGNS